MIRRTYVVSLPNSQRTTPHFVDICVRSGMGTRLLPVANPITYGANVTAPPAGWVAACGDAAYYEIRGRVLPIERLFGVGAAGGFTERTRLGFKLVVTPYSDWGAAAGYSPASAQLSQTLWAAVGGDIGGAVPATNLADPVYGPVIRVFTPQIGETLINSMLLLIHFDIAQQKDEDLTLGSP